MCRTSFLCVICDDVNEEMIYVTKVGRGFEPFQLKVSYSLCAEFLRGCIENGRVCIAAHG